MPLAAPADLLKLPLIDPADPWWTAWFEEAGINAPDLSGRAGIGVDNQQLAGRAALAGHGVAILMPAFFREELASGQLVQPFPIVKRSGEEPYWLVYPEARRRSRKIRAFRDWILAEVGKETSGSAAGDEPAAAGSMRRAPRCRSPRRRRSGRSVTPEGRKRKMPSRPSKPFGLVSADVSKRLSPNWRSRPAASTVAS